MLVIVMSQVVVVAPRSAWSLHWLTGGPGAGAIASAAPDVIASSTPQRRTGSDTRTAVARGLVPGRRRTVRNCHPHVFVVVDLGTKRPSSPPKTTIPRKLGPPGTGPLVRIRDEIVHRTAAMPPGNQGEVVTARSRERRIEAVGCGSWRAAPGTPCSWRSRWRRSGATTCRGDRDRPRTFRTRAWPSVCHRWHLVIGILGCCIGPLGARDAGGLLTALFLAPLWLPAGPPRLSGRRRQAEYFRIPILLSSSRCYRCGHPGRTRRPRLGRIGTGGVPGLEESPPARGVGQEGDA